MMRYPGESVSSVIPPLPICSSSWYCPSLRPTSEGVAMAAEEAKAKAEADRKAKAEADAKAKAEAERKAKAAKDEGEKDGDGVVLWVHDSGPGVSEEDADRIFERAAEILEARLDLQDVRR